MTLPTTFEIRLEFLSDWHIGTGQGRLGTIDAEVRRDADNLPFVPAKTLLGVWRDACETVAQAFDPATGRKPWGEWVTWLFGSQAGETNGPDDGLPVPAALRLTPARVPEPLRARVARKPNGTSKLTASARSALAQAAVVLRPGVAIDDETGTAADRLLRVEERAIRSLRLHSQVSIATTGSPTTADSTAAGGELPAPAELLLRAGARLIEAIGGKRNRGAGRVAVLLPDAHLDDSDLHPTLTDPRLAELLAAGVPPTPPPPPAPPAPVTFYPYHGRYHDAQRRTVRVVLRALTPVVAAETVLGNVISSRDAIPGTALLGTILSRAEAPTNGDGTRQGRVGLNDVRVGDAVPAIGDPEEPATVRPAHPVPRVWLRGDKGRGSTVHNKLEGEPPRDERAKPMSGWIVTDGDRWRCVRPATEVSTHAVIDDNARRPTVASGGVYIYLGIAPGTLLCSDIVLPSEVQLRLARGERLRFGRSRKDDFGLVEVVGVVDPVPEPPLPPRNEGELRVWCVSDVLLRDERLTPDPSPRALARALEQALSSEQNQVSLTVDVERSDSAATRRDGFGVAWGRPRPSQVALRAGSVVTLRVKTGEIEPERLAELERDGIGERTAEGYGRVRFNPPELTTQPTVDFSGDQPVDGVRPGPKALDALPAVAPDEPEHPLELNAWRRAIQRASAQLNPDQLVPGISRLAGNRAQLGSLRAQLERLTLPNGPDLVRHWLDTTRAITARRETWTDGVLARLRSLLLDNPELIWKCLGLSGSQPDLVLGPDREDQLRDRLHTEALTAALTDMLRRLVRQHPGTDDAGATRASNTLPAAKENA